MCCLCVDMKEITSYSNMDSVFKKVEDSIILSYSFRRQDFIKKYYDDILLHIKSLENEVLCKYNNEMIEIKNTLDAMSSLSLKEIQPVFSNLDDSIKRKIFSYFYWKYKNENSTEKIDLRQLKKIFGYDKAKEKYIEPYQATMKCHKCGGEGIIYIYTYEDSYINRRIEYKCRTCGHHEESESDSKAYTTLLNCTCKSCKKIKEELYHVIKDNLKFVNQDLKNKLIEEYSKIKEITLPSEIQMEEDCRHYKGGISKTVREVLFFKPKNVDELNEAIECINSRDYDYLGENRNILADLKKYRIIYQNKEKISDEELNSTLEKDLMKKTIKRYDFVNNLLTYLETATFEDFYKIYKGHLIFRIDNITISYNYELNYKNQFPLPLSDEFFQQKIILNNYYFKEIIVTANIETLIKNKIVKCIFNSKAEGNVYQILKNQYKDYFIIPNIKFYQVFDATPLERMMDSKEYSYISKSILDYVVYNRDGYPVKVIELQKSEHHNDPEWIWKDNAKRRAVEILRIEYEEIF